MRAMSCERVLFSLPCETPSHRVTIVKTIKLLMDKYHGYTRTLQMNPSIEQSDKRHAAIQKDFDE